jgi:hypothetical protein
LKPSWSALLLALAAQGAAAGTLEPRAPDLAAKFENVTLVLGPVRRLAYGSHNGTVVLKQTQNGVLVEVQKRYLWSPVIEMVAADMDGDGQDEIIGFTQNARLFVLRGTDLQDLWNTPERRYSSIRALTVGDTDADGRKEILVVADDALRIYAGLQDVVIWQSTDKYADTDICMGDVDGDGKQEIVLNVSGKVLDAAFREVEWQYDAGFGSEIELFDIDGDGKLEILGFGSDQLLRIFDVDERRLKID